MTTLATSMKTHTCGALRADDAGRHVVLAGWVHRRRDHGGLIFVDLRDRWGITQIVFDPSVAPHAHAVASEVRSEYVLRVTGVVERRPAGTENARMATGEIEVAVHSADILNGSLTPPFYIYEEGPVDEALRLRFRYLDLRRTFMTHNIVTRARTVKFIRDWMEQREFVEIETPILGKSTPEGARDYLVPSRIHPGEFYALPQSPQQYKQLLMVSGFERYFQIARCFRDEDLRADRQPEFTQLDVEMSFVDQEDILRIVEELFTALAAFVRPDAGIPHPFPRLTYGDAMARFGIDRPDLRFGMELFDVSDVAATTDFQVFRQAVAAGGQVKGLVVEGAAGYSRKQIDELTEVVRRFGAKGLATVAVVGDVGAAESPAAIAEAVRSPIAKFLSPDQLKTIVERASANPGDLIVMVADRPAVVAESLGRLRVELGRRLGLADPQQLAFAWVVDFPAFEWREEEHRWDAVHHPFTAPKDEDLPFLTTDPARVRAKQYDLICNGWELGGGSIRISDPAVQVQVFQVMGHSEENVERQFGHLLTAFRYGVPPHGGIAVGIDRLSMILAGADNIRDVVAFPKTQSATDLLMGAPSPVAEEQLKELHVRLTGDE